MDGNEITWLRGSCQDANTCEGVAKVRGDQLIYVVAKAVTDPDRLAAFAHRMGDGEVLVTVTDSLFPELG